MSEDREITGTQESSKETVEFIRGRNDQIPRTIQRIPFTRSGDHVDVSFDLNGQWVRQRVNVNRIEKRKVSKYGNF